MMQLRLRGRNVEWGDRTRFQGAEMRSFHLTDMVPYGWDARADSSGSVRVSTTAAMGLPAFARAVRFYAETVASMPLYAWQGTGVDRKRADRTYQGQLFGQVPNPVQDLFQFWETVVESLCVPRNAYIWKMKDAGRVFEWWALDPLQVNPYFNGSELRYEVKCNKGFVDPVGRGGKYDLGGDTILHIKGTAAGGLIATSLIEQHRDALAADIAAQQTVTNMLGRGARLDYIFTLPPGIGRTQVQEFKDNYKQTNTGPRGDTTMVLPPGMDVKPIGMTAKDAEMVAFANLSLSRSALMLGIPVELLGVTGTPGDRQPLEELMRNWYSFGLGSMLIRIEKAVGADTDIFPLGTRTTYPGFKADDFIRADSLTESQIMHQKIQDGELLVDEARALDGLPPLPNGAGQVPQIVPVGGTPNPPGVGQPAPGDAGGVTP